MNNENIPTLRRVASYFLVLAFVAGCAASTPMLDTSSEAEATFDGLYPIKGGAADGAWARPGVDISQYSKIRLQGVGIEYRPGGESGRLYTSRTRAEHFEVTEEQRAIFESLMRETFREELGQSTHFTLVEENGPDVLLILGGLLDVVSFAPPDLAGRGNIYLSSVGEATLVLEIRDSITQATLVRAIDRRAASRTGRDFTQSNTVTNRVEARRLAQLWARRLRTRLDELAARAQ